MSRLGCCFLPFFCLFGAQGFSVQAIKAREGVSVTKNGDTLLTTTKVATEVPDWRPVATNLGGMAATQQFNGDAGTLCLYALALDGGRIRHHPGWSRTWEWCPANRVAWWGQTCMHVGPRLCA